MSSPWTESQQLAIDVTVAASGALGFVGATTMFFMVLRLPRADKYTRQHLLLALAAVEMLGIAGKALGRFPAMASESLCIAQGIVIQLGASYAVIIAALATDTLLRVFFLWKNEEAGRLLKWYLLAAVLLPAITISVTLPLGAVGLAGPWCFITNKYPTLRLCLFFVPIWSVMAYSAIVSGLLIKRLLETWKAVGRPVQTSAILQVSSWSLVYILTWSTATANRVQQTLYPGQPSFPLVMLNVAFIPAHGFIDFLVYAVPIWWSRMRQRKALSELATSSSQNNGRVTITSGTSVLLLRKDSSEALKAKGLRSGSSQTLTGSRVGGSTDTDFPFAQERDTNVPPGSVGVIVERDEFDGDLAGVVGKALAKKDSQDGSR